MLIDILLFTKGGLVLALGSWLLLAAYNNLIDPQTNVQLLSQMTSMQAIKIDNDFGLGLLRRALKNTHWMSQLLKLIASCQILVALFLMIAGGLVMLVSMQLIDVPVTAALDWATLAVFAFMLIWISFILGGLWFGYWIKMGNVQMVHFTLLIISILTLIYLHLPNMNTQV
ncbi:DUF2165 family protein [Catenovulum sp. SX2]|uniref:DUF2165 family protein n=1 Tax=Catenovulum sp. SX2 TaxID=3398614 RepID=UPI003F877D77